MDDTTRNGETIHHDDGNEYVLGEDGNRRPPLQTRPNSKPGEFTTFDSSQGHCGLCGRLTCPGNCFR